MALVSTIGTEFGEIDRPSRGGYTEPGWNKGAFGASLEGTSNEGFALPPSVLKPYGYGKPDFASNFNKNYDIRVVNPSTGQSVVGPLKDIGPGPGTNAGIDILWGSRARLGFGQNFKGNVQYEIVPKGSVASAGTFVNPATGNVEPLQGQPAVAAAPAATSPAGPTSPAASYLTALTGSAPTGNPQMDRINQLSAAMQLSGADPVSKAIQQGLQYAKTIQALRMSGIFGAPRAQLVSLPGGGTPSA